MFLNDILFIKKKYILKFSKNSSRFNPTNLIPLKIIIPSYTRLERSGDSNTDHNIY